MRFFTITFLIGVVFTSCTSSNNSTEDEQNIAANEVVPEWELSFDSYAATEDSCPNMECTFIEVSIPQLSGGKELARNKINAFIDSLSRAQLKGQLPENLGNASYQVLCESFIDGYDLFLMEFPDSEQNWSYLMSSEKSSLGVDYFTLHLSIESYLGGAHPNTLIIVKSFDLSTGNEIDIVAHYDAQQLRMLAEQYFRAYHNLDSSMPLNDGGFLFEDGKFVLPENIAYVDSGLVLIYNTYEVASYAEGGTSFVLPYDVLSKK